ncbi:MAG: hypothetical protein ACOWWH_12830 [Eubacteriaceae bacterium]
MKKKAILILCIFIIFISFTGCSEKSSKETTKENNDVLFSLDADAALKQLYGTIDEYNKSDAVEAIVKGNITDVEYVYINGCSYSILTIDVEQFYKGNKGKKTIKVYEDGGYVKYTDIRNELKSKSDFSEENLTEDQINNGIVDFRFFNAPHSQKGQKVLLYLFYNVEPLPTDSYMIVSSVYGKFTLNEENNKYERISINNDGEEIFENFVTSMPEEELNSKLTGAFTK